MTALPSLMIEQLKSLRRNWITAGCAAAVVVAGLLLRLWSLAQFPQINGDTLLYGNLATNILLHGRFAIADGSGVLHTTLIRLPGYPLFIALCFWFFGIANYAAVQYIQIAFDLFTAILVADFVRRLTDSKPAAFITLALAALCPFTAFYTPAPLTEIPTLFLIALALWSMQCFADAFEAQATSGKCWLFALLFTFAVTSAAMLRPDGALVAIALVPALLISAFRAIQLNHTAEQIRPAQKKLMRMVLLCALLAALPFAAWTLRNWQRFHVFEPLAPRYATDPGESNSPGWQRWTKTWCLDFVSTYQIYWNVPDDKIDPSQLPERAFDSPEERSKTLALIDDYNKTQELTPEIDARFAQLAAERIEAHPLRYYLWLPLGRVADMWLRPRVENLPIDLDWLVYAHHNSETRISYALAMLAYFLLRSLLLATIEAPEARYTLECFPMLFALGGIALCRMLFGGFIIPLGRQREGALR